MRVTLSPIRYHGETVHGRSPQEIAPDPDFVIGAVVTGARHEPTHRKFERGTNDMWRNLSAERFGNKIEGLIRRYHTTIGGAFIRTIENSALMLSALDN